MTSGRGEAQPLALSSIVTTDEQDSVEFCPLFFFCFGKEYKLPIFVDLISMILCGTTQDAAPDLLDGFGVDRADIGPRCAEVSVLSP